MKILNLHGFMGEADNKNYKALCEIFPAEDIISPQLNYKETSPEKLLEQLSDMVDTDDFIFVGQSLGGWYADKLSRSFKRPCILTNPCYYPYELEIISTSNIPDEFLQQYRDMSVKTHNARSYTLCSDSDTIIPGNFAICVKLAKSVLRVHGSHSTIDDVGIFIADILRDLNEVVQLRNRLKKQFLDENTKFADTNNLDYAFDQAIVEVMKRIHDRYMKNTEKSMEKAFFSGEANKNYLYGSKKEHLKRLLKKLEEYRYAEGKKIAELSGEFPDELKRLKKETDTSKNNLESNHYSISDQNTIEIETFDTLEICKVILNKRISDVKKVSISQFKDLYNEYDEHYKSIIANAINTSDDEYLDAFFDFFNFEEKFSLEFVYSLADFVLINNISDEILERAKWLYLDPISTPNCSCCNNRSFFLRKQYIPFLLMCNNNEFNERLYDYRVYIELVFWLKKHFITDDTIEAIPKKAWVDYFRLNYKLFNEFDANKIWDNKKIRIARKIFEKWSGQGVL